MSVAHVVRFVFDSIRNLLLAEKTADDCNLRRIVVPILTLRQHFVELLALLGFSVVRAVVGGPCVKPIAIGVIKNRGFEPVIDDWLSANDLIVVLVWM